MKVSLNASPRRESEAAKTRKTRWTTMKPPSSPRPEFRPLRTGAGRTTLRILVRLPKRASVEMAESLSGRCTVSGGAKCLGTATGRVQGQLEALKMGFHSCPTLIDGALRPIIVSVDRVVRGTDLRHLSKVAGSW